MIFASVRRQYALFYTEGIIIFSKTAQKHVRYIEEVHKLHKDVGVTSKLKNCHLFSESVDYLGHSIAPAKLQVDKKSTEVIAALRYITKTF